VRVLYPPTPREDRSCAVWRERGLRRIEAVRPALVVVSASFHYTVLDGGDPLGRGASTQALAAGYAPTLARLRAAATRVAVIGDAPRPPLNVPDCVSGALRHLRRCAFPRGPATRDSGVIGGAAARVDGIRAIDPAGAFCLADLCPAVIGNVLVYRNSGHVTASYARTLRPWLERRLR
jgi:hypothetical protein